MRLIGRRGLTIILGMLLVLGSVSGLLTPGGTAKVAAASEEWIYCADEGGFCSFSGTKEVRYGIYEGYVTNIFTDGVSCETSAITNVDPMPFYPKKCYIRDADFTVFAGGTGSEVSPYLIATAKQLECCKRIYEYRSCLF